MGSVVELIQECYAQERSGHIGTARQRADDAVNTARSEGDPAAVAAALNAAALVRFRVGQYDEARALAEQALASSAADGPERADALLLRGMCATETDDLAAGQEYYLKAIDLSRQIGYRRALAHGLHDLAAGIHMPRGQFELSLAADMEAVHLARDDGAHDLVESALVTIAWVYWLVGRREQSAATCRELQQVALPGSNADGFRLCFSANLAVDDGDVEGAESLFSRARSIADLTGEPSLCVLVRLGLSRHRRLAGNAAAARAWATDALTLVSRLGYRHFQGMALVERARGAWLAGDRTMAENDLNVAIGLLGAIGAGFDLARARFFLAALMLECEGRPGLEWLEAARAILDGNYAFLLEQERALAYPFVAICLNHPDPQIASPALALLSHLERVPALPLHIRTLGRFQVRQGSRTIPDHFWRQRRAGELFRLLLVSPDRALERDEIVEALWHGRSHESVQALFHQATSALRRALEPELPDKFPSRYLRIQDGRVCLNLPTGSWVDFETFGQCVDRAEWQAACLLYQGDLFPSDRYAAWAVVPRERLIRLYLRTLLAAAGQDLRTDPQAALDKCRRVLEIDPWQENAVLIGMRACVAANDRATALRLYRELERTLRDDLDTAPEETLRRLYRSLL